MDTQGSWRQDLAGYNPAGTRDFPEQVQPWAQGCVPAPPSLPSSQTFPVTLRKVTNSSSSVSKFNCRAFLVKSYSSLFLLLLPDCSSRVSSEHLSRGRKRKTPVSLSRHKYTHSVPNAFLAHRDKTSTDPLNGLFPTRLHNAGISVLLSRRRQRPSYLSCRLAAPEIFVPAPHSEMLVPRAPERMLKCSITPPEIAICATQTLDVPAAAQPGSTLGIRVRFPAHTQAQGCLSSETLFGLLF